MHGKLLSLPMPGPKTEPCWQRPVFVRSALRVADFFLRALFGGEVIEPLPAAGVPNSPTRALESQVTSGHTESFC
jgi:hypothetical protein